MVTTPLLFVGEFGDKDAAEKYERHKTSDPFQDIAPALLNSADIQRYVKAVGLVTNFDADNLKSATYRIQLFGEVYVWDDGESNTKQKAAPQITPLHNKAKDSFVLKHNSIVFVSLRDQFRLPNYIALRFNLSIRLVHQGLLLGTGPLVDPGFEGRLLVPVHNLTSNDYTLRAGDDFIWVEFTKISSDETWGGIKRTDGYKFIGFPEGKKKLGAEEYFKKASPHKGISSSMQELMQRQDAVDNKLTLFRNISYAAVVMLVLAFIALLWQANALVQDAVSYVGSSKSEIDKKVTDNEKRLGQLEGENAKIRKMLEEMKKSLAANKSKDHGRSAESK